jgi:adenylate kinase
MKKLPNILITGTPGVGKSTTSVQVAEKTGLNYIEVSQFVKDHSCHYGMDTDYDTYILDEDSLCDKLEEILKLGGYIVDFHSPEIFPESWFDLVLVLRARNDILFDRLTLRRYNEKKISENMECEIMQVVLDAAIDCYDPNIVVELNSNNHNDIESNVQRLCQWFSNWKENNK